MSAMDVQGYNTQLRVAGDHLTIKRFDKTLLFGYSVPECHNTPKGCSEYNRENFYKSVTRARKTLFELIVCNVGRIPTYDGKIVGPKFVTLTFAENVTDITWAHDEFCKYNKRLSWALYGVKKNVLKYVAVPEFQKRGAIHYHVLYFNLPYISHETLHYTWLNGNVSISGVKDDIIDFAKYVAKYMSKTNSKGEDNYELYRERGLLNRKRFLSSKGLKRPDVHKFWVGDDNYKSLLAALKPYHIGNYLATSQYICVDNNYYENPPKEELNNYINTLRADHNHIYSHDVVGTKSGDKNKPATPAVLHRALWKINDLAYYLGEKEKEQFIKSLKIHLDSYKYVFNIK